jgi:hypothetical protein
MPGKVSGKNDAENRKNDINERVHGTKPPEGCLDAPYIADRGNAIWTPICHEGDKIRAWLMVICTIKSRVSKPRSTNLPKP